MTNCFKLELTPPVYGWTYLMIKNNNHIEAKIRISEVFNPFFSLCDLLKTFKSGKTNPNRLMFLKIERGYCKVPEFYETSLNDARRGIFRFSIDQEGSLATIIFKIVGSTVSVDFGNKTIKFNLRQMVNEFENELKRFTRMKSIGSDFVLPKI